MNPEAPQGAAPPRLRVHPHREGPWLVVLGRRRLAVPPELGRRLLDLDGGRPGVLLLADRLGLEPAAVAALQAGGAHRAAGRRRGPWLRLELLPECAVRNAARAAGLTGGWALALIALGGGWLVAAAGDLRFALPSAGAYAVAVSLFLLGGGVHEWGHAAALARGGYPPGGIGVGLMTVVPVLWCDVSAAALLPGPDRVRVDLAGPVFQIGVAGLLAAASCALPPPLDGPFAAAAAWSLAAVAWSLTPVFRSDAFWLLTDLLDLDDLDRLPRSGDTPRTVALLSGYRLLHGIFFAAVAAVLLGRGGRDTIAAALWTAAGVFIATVTLRRLLLFAAALRRKTP